MSTLSSRSNVRHNKSPDNLHEKVTVSVDRSGQTTPGKLFEDLNQIKKRAECFSSARDSDIEEMSRQLVEAKPPDWRVDAETLKWASKECLLRISQLPEIISAFEELAKDAPPSRRHEHVVALVHLVRADANSPDSAKEMYRLLVDCSAWVMFRIELMQRPSYWEWINSQRSSPLVKGECQKNLQDISSLLFSSLAPDQMVMIVEMTAALNDDLQTCSQWDALDPEAMDKRMSKLIDNPLLNGPVLDQKDILGSLSEPMRTKIVSLAQQSTNIPGQDVHLTQQFRENLNHLAIGTEIQNNQLGTTEGAIVDKTLSGARAAGQSVEARVPVRCDACMGTGRTRCPSCHGCGYVLLPVPLPINSPFRGEPIPPIKCSCGTGWVTCCKCNGRGWM
jgi:hypothetical protein